ncbi:hypothetical protein DL89DRAFT_270564 [Linderina pennispora]|uniref:CoA-dependent acyltransferase n=1 Tax=Linderina pennispora TaxID=61395 RepID=A0A1Y1VXB1_9FUNG|nr:uncharacterized protein DL89DRAFT_270564 [Linderina pennispora]ORX65843.1 hypothetical protein DL89DRAFT_270564 [Linderina pennispora]
MPNSVLKESFYRTLRQFPILAGHIHSRRKGIHEIVVDKYDLNMPEYLESSDESLHFNKLRDANFNFNIWPASLETAGGLCKVHHDGRIKLLNAHIVRLQQNSGLIIFISIAHCIVDSAASLYFIARWAEETRALLGGTPSTTRIIPQNLPVERSPIESSMRDIYEMKTLFGNFLASLSPKVRARLIYAGASTKNLRTSAFVISRPILENLHDAIAEFVHDGMRISDNDIVTALRLMTSRLRRLINKVLGKQQKHQVLLQQCIGIACDIRHRIGIDQTKYVGNGTFVQLMFSDPADVEPTISPRSLAWNATRVRRSVASVMPPYVSEYFDMVNSRPRCFTRRLVYISRNRGAGMVSNMSRQDHYLIDFGGGTPSFAATIPIIGANNVYIFRCPPPSRDLLVYLCADSSVMEKVRQNEFLNSVVEHLFTTATSES